MGICASSFDKLDGMEITPDMIEKPDQYLSKRKYHAFLKWEYVPEKIKQEVLDNIDKEITATAEEIHNNKVTNITVYGVHVWLRRNVLNKDDISFLLKQPIIEVLKKRNIKNPFIIRASEYRWFIDFFVNPEPHAT